MSYLNNEYKSHSWAWESSIPSEVCDLIVSEYLKHNSSKGLVIEGDQDKRNADIIFENMQWINALTIGYIKTANYMNFNYDLSIFDKEDVQFSIYKKNQFYGTHIDSSPYYNNIAETRKLSLSLQLSDPKDYEGGELILYGPDNQKKWTMLKSKGTVIVFSSNILHEVTPIISGTRYSLVKWYHGDKSFR